jgi:hypothetical protein
LFLGEKISQLHFLQNEKQILRFLFLVGGLGVEDQQIATANSQPYSL